MALMTQLLDAVFYGVIAVYFAIKTAMCVDGWWYWRKADARHFEQTWRRHRLQFFGYLILFLYTLFILTR